MSAGVSVYHPGGPIAYIKPFYQYGQTEVIINYCSALKAGPGGKCDRKLGNVRCVYAIKNKGLYDRLCDGTYHNLPITA